MPEPQVFYVSLSAVDAFRQCEQLYYNRQILKLSRKAPSLAPTRGRALHSYFEAYYGNLKGEAPLNSEDVHVEALTSMHEKVDKESRGFANAAYMMGAEELAQELFDLPAQAESLCQRYFAVRGKDDAITFIPLLVEKWVQAKLTRGIVNRGVVDLITVRNGSIDEGAIRSLWEHKSHESIPSQYVRLENLQVCLYAAHLEAEGIKPDEVIWNYVRTKSPTIPKLLASGLTSLDKSVDTTWEIYKEALISRGEDPKHSKFAEIKARLEPRELEVFFPRYTLPLVQQANVLLDDFVATARHMRMKVNQWKQGVDIPRRTITRNCEWCDFAK